MRNAFFLLAVLLVLACIAPVAAEVAPMRDDGQLKYNNFPTPSGTYGMRPAGHAVYFTNSVPTLITGVRVYGCKYGDNAGNVRFEIWDENMTTLYSDTVPYDKIPFTTAARQADLKNSLSWQAITLPEHLVTGNFYYVLFTDSAPFGSGHGMRIGFTQPTAAFTSHAVLSGPNRISEKTINAETGTFTTDKVDWMIRPLYTDAPAATATTAQQTTAVTTQAAAAGTTAGVSTTAAAAVPTKAPVETGIIVIAAVLGLGTIRKGM